MGYSKYGLEPICRINPCADGKQNLGHTTNELILFEGHCVKLNSPSILCPQKEDVVTFRKGTLEPVCTKSTKKTHRRLFRRQITKTNELKCQSGYGKAKAGSTRCYRLLKISR